MQTTRKPIALKKQTPQKQQNAVFHVMVKNMVKYVASCLQKKVMFQKVYLPSATLHWHIGC